MASGHMKVVRTNHISLCRNVMMFRILIILFYLCTNSAWSRSANCMRPHKNKIGSIKSVLGERLRECRNRFVWYGSLIIVGINTALFCVKDDISREDEIQLASERDVDGAVIQTFRDRFVPLDDPVDTRNMECCKMHRRVSFNSHPFCGSI